MNVILRKGTWKPAAQAVALQVVERALSELQARFKAAAGGPRVGVVRLSGLVHTDERAAFQEIARQLCGAFGCTFSRAAGVEQNMSFLGNMLRMLHKCASCYPLCKGLKSDWCLRVRLVSIRASR